MCATLPNLPHYKQILSENKILQQIFEELKKNQLTQHSLSPCVVVALLVPNKDDNWRMCMDSWAINKITIKFRIPKPIIEEMLERLSAKKYSLNWIFAVVTIKSGFVQGMNWKLLLRHVRVYMSGKSCPLGCATPHPLSWA